MEKDTEKETAVTEPPGTRRGAGAGEGPSGAHLFPAHSSPRAGLRVVREPSKELSPGGTAESSVVATGQEGGEGLPCG